MYLCVLDPVSLIGVPIVAHQQGVRGSRGEPFSVMPKLRE
jgi:hypothetical protein